MKTIEELKALKEIGVTYYKDNEIEVKFTENHTITHFTPMTTPMFNMSEPIPNKKDTLEDELFNI